MSTDWRALCAELISALADFRPLNNRELAALDRARAALAEPVGEGPTDNDLLACMIEAARSVPDGQAIGIADWDQEAIAAARAVLAHFGHQPAPSAEGEVGELVAWLRDWGDDYADEGTKWHRAADLLERQAAPVLEPALARINDILNDSGRVCLADEREALELARQALEQRHPAPPAAGEVGELVEFLRDWGDDYADEGTKWHRAADLLERQAAPVPVAERLQQLEDLAADAVSGLRYIEQTHGRLYGVGWDRVYEKADRLQPGHALPLPAGEVQP